MRFDRQHFDVAPAGLRLAEDVADNAGIVWKRGGEGAPFGFVVRDGVGKAHFRDIGREGVVEEGAGRAAFRLEPVPRLAAVGRDGGAERANEFTPGVVELEAQGATAGAAHAEVEPEPVTPRGA